MTVQWRSFQSRSLFEVYACINFNERLSFVSESL